MRKPRAGLQEKRFGYGGFLQFAKAARSRGFVEMEFDEQADDYVLRPATPPRAASPLDVAGDVTSPTSKAQV